MKTDDRHSRRNIQPYLPHVAPCDAPSRKKLPHDVPCWIAEDEIYFVTICTRPRGVNQLCRPDVGNALWSSVMDREVRNRWWVHVLLLMPDHLHMVISAAPLHDLAGTVGSWKRFTARFVGIRWQRDFFEHRLRRDESFSDKAEYIRQNPVRAGLARTPDDWPYLWQKAR